MRPAPLCLFFSSSGVRRFRQNKTVPAYFALSSILDGQYSIQVSTSLPLSITCEVSPTRAKLWITHRICSIHPHVQTLPNDCAVQDFPGPPRTTVLYHQRYPEGPALRINNTRNVCFRLKLEYLIRPFLVRTIVMPEIAQIQLSSL